MNKRNSFLISLLPLLLTACGEPTYEYHAADWYPKVQSIIYADQPEDTTHLVNTDSWTATTDAEWLTVSPGYLEIPEGYIADQKMTFTATPNTTGKTRSAFVSISSYHSLSYAVTQLAWLNVIRPSSHHTTPDVFTLELRDKKSVRDSVEFRVYCPAATLKSLSPWLTLEAEWKIQETDPVSKKTVWTKKTGDTFPIGKIRAFFTYEREPEGKKREGKLALTSAGITTEINIIQPERSTEETEK